MRPPKSRRGTVTQTLGEHGEEKYAQSTVEADNGNRVRPIRDEGAEEDSGKHCVIGEASWLPIAQSIRDGITDALAKAGALGSWGRAVRRGSVRHRASIAGPSGEALFEPGPLCNAFRQLIQGLIPGTPLHVQRASHVENTIVSRPLVPIPIFRFLARRCTPASISSDERRALKRVASMRTRAKTAPLR
jgi:hypothetical protein